MLWLPAGAMGRGVERGAEEMLVPLRRSECQVSRCLGFFFGCRVSLGHAPLAVAVPGAGQSGARGSRDGAAKRRRPGDASRKVWLCGCPRGP